MSWGFRPPPSVHGPWGCLWVGCAGQGLTGRGLSSSQTSLPPFPPHNYNDWPPTLLILVEQACVALSTASSRQALNPSHTPNQSSLGVRGECPDTCSWAGWAPQILCGCGMGQGRRAQVPVEVIGTPGMCLANLPLAGMAGVEVLPWTDVLYTCRLSHLSHTPSWASKSNCTQVGALRGLQAQLWSCSVLRALTTHPHPIPPTTCMGGDGRPDFHIRNLVPTPGQSLFARGQQSPGRSRKQAQGA